MSETNDKVQEKAKNISISLLIILIAFSIILYAFWQITDEVVLEKESGFDDAVYRWVVKTRHPVLTNIMIFFSFFGSRSFLLPAYIILVGYYLFYRKKRSTAISTAAVALSGGIILPVLKNIFKRNRPLQPLVDLPTSFSYPSGHSFSAFNFCGILIYLIWITNIRHSFKWLLTICLLIFASTICFSRVYLHVHYASDVIAGFCLSFIWLTICYFILKKFKLIEKMQE